MSERVTNIKDMLVATREFNAANSADYAALIDGAAMFAIVADVITKLENYLSEQASGGSGQAVEQKAALVVAVRRKMKRLAESARALNLQNEGFRRLFRIPDENGVPGLIAAGRQFVEGGLDYKTDFARLGIDEAYINSLGADLDDLEAANAAKAGAHAKTVGATAGIDHEIERAMAAEIFLDAMMKNVYRDKPVKLAEWRTARHVKHSSRTPKPKPQA